MPTFMVGLKWILGLNEFWAWNGFGFGMGFRLEWVLGLNGSWAWIVDFRRHFWVLLHSEITYFLIIGLSLRASDWGCLHCHDPKPGVMTGAIKRKLLYPEPVASLKNKTLMHHIHKKMNLFKTFIIHIIISVLIKRNTLLKILQILKSPFKYCIHKQYTTAALGIVNN